MSHISRPQFAADAAAQFAADAAWLESEWGIVLPYSASYLPKEFRRDARLAADAQPTLVTPPNAGIPFWFTQYVDPETVRVLQVPNKGASILGEEKRGTWTTQSAWFPMIENTGEVSSYGDFNMNGRSDVNTAFESRQSYLFQTFYEVGDLEAERAEEAKLNLAAEKKTAAAKTLDKFLDYTYHFGVQNLECYGLLNDPSLPPAITPTTKAAGGTKWITNGSVTAQANEIYADVQLLFQSMSGVQAGIIDMETRFRLVSPSAVQAAYSATNQFGITTRELILKSFPNVEFVSDPRYATAGGNIVQLIALEVDGNQTGYCAFNEKMREHLPIRSDSSYRQKVTSGTWGAVIRYPVGYSQIIGV